MTDDIREMLSCSTTEQLMIPLDNDTMQEIVDLCLGDLGLGRVDNDYYLPINNLYSIVSKKDIDFIVVKWLDKSVNNASPSKRMTFLREVIWRIPKIYAADSQEEKWEMPILNGIVDLRTGKVSPYGDRNVFRQVDIEWDGTFYKTPIFDETVDSVLGGSKAGVWFKCYLGYCMTGETTDKSFIVFSGDSNTGKSAPLKIFRNILKTNGNPYVVDSLALLLTGSEDCAKHMSAREMIIGCRLALITELNTKHLVTNTVNTLVDTDSVVLSKKMHKDITSHEVTYKIIATTNSLPHLTASQNGIKTRMINIESMSVERNQDNFEKYVIDNDTKVGLFSRFVKYAMGYYKYYHSGKKSLRRSVREHLSFNIRDTTIVNPAESFIQNCCNASAEHFTSNADLDGYMQEFFNSLDILKSDASYPTKDARSKALKKMGYKKVVVKNVRGWAMKVSIPENNDN